MTGQRLVDAVVHDLIDHVVQSTTRHRCQRCTMPGRFANLASKPFENLDGICAVFPGAESVSTIGKPSLLPNLISIFLSRPND